MKKLIKSGLLLLGYEVRKRPNPFSDNERQTLLRQAGEFVDKDIRKIHYGCANNIFDGWINSDLTRGASDSPLFMNADLLARHPFPDNWFEFGYAEDFLEHFSQADSLLFFTEVYRTFRPGGVLRLSFPGLEGVLKKHYINADYNVAKTAEEEAYNMWGHLHFYSKEELALVCRHIGFAEITFVEHGLSVYSALNGLDGRPNQIGLNTYVEIKK